ncbi:transposase [Blautia producta]|nr:transposase [Blautia producta]NSG17768.1 transposase [Blautia producta]NSJ77945.1 transposase [Blautia producta]
MIGESILLDSIYGGLLMRSKRIPAEEQYRLIMECRQSGLTDHQWCVEHDIKPGTFYNWVKRLRQKGCMDLPASTGRSHSAPESQEVVRVDFHDTDTPSYEQPLNMIPASTERNNISVAELMRLSVGSFLLTIPNGTDPKLLAQTLRIMKELEC